MTRFLLDTTFMVAAACAWHPDHRRAVTEIGNRIERADKMVLAGPALVEAYSVLTRMPSPHRLRGEDALALIERSFIRVAPIVALDAEEYTALLRRVVNDGILGGRVYDAVIAQCAAKAGVSALLTFNGRDFRGVAPSGIEVVP